MKSLKFIAILFLISLLVWVGEVIYLAQRNATAPNRIKAAENQRRNRENIEYQQKTRELEQDYDKKKHLATGKTVFDRIYNTQGQSIIDLILRISDEALPESWSSDVKVEEFTHFILLIYLPHNSERPTIDQVTSRLQAIMKYCSSWLSDVAIFDRRHKSYLFFDKPLLTSLKSGRSLSKEMAKQAANHGFSFTRFNRFDLSHSDPSTEGS